MKNEHVLGIDISKSKFDVCLLEGPNTERFGTFPNNFSGFEAMMLWLDQKGVVSFHACMEATGRLWENLAAYIYAKGQAVSVVNPAKVKGFGQSELKRIKNDKMDAAIIARFCRAHHPILWQPQEPELNELKDAERRLVELKAHRTQELNRLKSGVTSAVVVSSIEELIASLNVQIKQLEKWLKNQVKANAQLKTHFDLITSIPGVSDGTAITYLAELGYVGRFQTLRQLEVFAGMIPRQKSSGSSVQGRRSLSKIGSAHLRRALYMPALSAMKHNPIIKDFADRLRQAGKRPKIVICAVMRKLLRLIYAVLRSGRPFDPLHVSQPPMPVPHLMPA